MTTLKNFKILQTGIYSAVFAAVDEQGLCCGNCFRICPVKAVGKVG